MVEVPLDYVAEDTPSRVNDSALWNDRAYQDMNDPRFSSRTQHREYMKQHGLTTVDDYRGEWKSKEYRRLQVKQGIDPSRRKDIDRAIHQLVNKGK